MEVLDIFYNEFSIHNLVDTIWQNKDYSMATWKIWILWETFLNFHYCSLRMGLRILTNFFFDFVSLFSGNVFLKQTKKQVKLPID